MSLKIVAESKTLRLEVLDEQGRADASLDPQIAPDTLLKMYRTMFEIRAFDEVAFRLQRQGRLGTYPQILGQEATQVVPALALKPADWLVPTYRGQGAYYARGMKLRYSLLYWGGDDRGVHFPEETNDLIFAIPVASHLTQAAGLAWASKIKKDGGAALAYLGDGASSKGDFHEALTFAGAFKLPVIYLIENNHWAISVPRDRQAACETLAQKAAGYGVYGLQVDGNDALAVWKGVSEALDRARSGEGATVLECETYRLGHHTTADDATRYRSSAEVESWKRKDPVLRLKAYLEGRGLWDESREAELKERTQKMIAEEVRAYEDFPPPNPLDMFANNYARAPWALIEQRAELARILEESRDLAEIASLPPPEGRFP
jgi:pyruvate dehydrogenase E1 component alpha subunit